MNALLLILIGLVIGFLMSGCIGFYLFCRLDSKWNRLSCDIDLHQTHFDLDRLRSGKIEAVIHSNELRLNTAVIGLARELRLIVPKRRRSGDVRWLRDAREYRTKFPYSGSSPETDAAIVEAFALVDKWPPEKLLR